MYKCEECSVLCPDSLSMLAHSKSHSTKDVHFTKCNLDILQAAKKSNPTITLHRSSKRKQHHNPKEEACLFKFAISEVVESQSAISEQVQKQGRERYYIPNKLKPTLLCKLCNKVFASQKCFDTHKRNHNRPEFFICDQCGKNFAYRCTLKVHMQIHTGEKKSFECDVCNAKLSCKINLGRHKLIHTNEKPLKCDECGKGFRKKELLKVHKMSHSGERPFKCTKCEKSFYRNCHLSKHQKVHSDLKDMKCKKCDKQFYTRTNLAMHMRSHNKKPKIRRKRKINLRISSSDSGTIDEEVVAQNFEITSIIKVEPEDLEEYSSAFD